MVEVYISRVIKNKIEKKEKELINEFQFLNKIGTKLINLTFYLTIKTYKTQKKSKSFTGKSTLRSNISENNLPSKFFDIFFYIYFYDKFQTKPCSN